MSGKNDKQILKYFMFDNIWLLDTNAGGGGFFWLHACIYSLALYELMKYVIKPLTINIKVTWIYEKRY